METRYLYVDGGFKDPIAAEEEKVPLKKREKRPKTSLTTASPVSHTRRTKQPVGH